MLITLIYLAIELDDISSGYFAEIHEMLISESHYNIDGMPLFSRAPACRHRLSFIRRHFRFAVSFYFYARNIMAYSGEGFHYRHTFVMIIAGLGG